LDAGNDRDAIKRALDVALYNETFKAKVAERVNPYGDGHSAERIVRILKTVSLDNLIQKRFYNGEPDHSGDRRDRIYRPAFA
jgi:UDP-N-acetylglucosamine 2-epimerase